MDGLLFTLQLKKDVQLIMHSKLICPILVTNAYGYHNGMLHFLFDILLGQFSYCLLPLAIVSCDSIQPMLSHINIAQVSICESCSFIDQILLCGSLVPRPSHVFQCFMQKIDFSCETLKNMGRPGHEASYVDRWYKYPHLSAIH